MLTFVQYDRPLTQDPVEMGVQGFLYLFREAEGGVRLHGLRRVLAFICSKTGRAMPGAPAIRAAAGIVTQVELDEDAIRGWFNGNCR